MNSNKEQNEKLSAWFERTEKSFDAPGQIERLNRELNRIEQELDCYGILVKVVREKRPNRIIVQAETSRLAWREAKLHLDTAKASIDKNDSGKAFAYGVLAGESLAVSKIALSDFWNGTDPVDSKKRSICVKAYIAAFCEANHKPTVSEVAYAIDPNYDTTNDQIVWADDLISPNGKGKHWKISTLKDKIHQYGLNDPTFINYLKDRCL